MAQEFHEIPDFEFITDAKTTGTLYPWDAWFNGNWWGAEYRVDFDISIHAFRSLLYRKAQEADGSVTVKVYGRKVFWQFAPLPEMPAAVQAIMGAHGHGNGKAIAGKVDK